MARKRKKKSSFLFKLIILILLIVIGVSGYRIGTTVWQYYQESKVYHAVAEEARGDKDAINWKKMLKKYPDLKAWLRCEDTVIDYPVVQGPDNDYYLHRLINGDYGWKGTLFIDCRNQAPFQDFVTVIYGHSMRDGTMFKPLFKFREQEFYDSHHTMYLETPDQKYDVEIIGTVLMLADSDRYKFEFSGDEEREEYIQWIKDNSMIRTDTKVSADDHILMMSTCAEATGENRVVVYGKLVRKSN